MQQLDGEQALTCSSYTERSRSCFHFLFQYPRIDTQQLDDKIKAIMLSLSVSTHWHPAVTQRNQSHYEHFQFHFQYPRIDTQQLDGEIKAIMLGVLPVLQEHMDDVCSQQLLEYVRQLVLSLTKPKGDNLEFLQFFNNQLNTILADSLAKFDGRK